MSQIRRWGASSLGAWAQLLQLLWDVRKMCFGKGMFDIVIVNEDVCR